MTISTVKQLHPDWFIDITNKDQAAFATSLKAFSGNINLKQLRKIVKRKLESVMASENGDISQYGSGDWIYKQSHINGNKQMLKWLDQVLDFVDE